MPAELPRTRAQAEALDRTDPLAFARSRFALPDGVIYLDGNSLGALPAGVPARMRDAVELEWGRGLIRSWNDAGWYPAPQRAAAKIATLIGAAADQVIVADSTSVNLFKLLMAAAAIQRRDPARTVIVAERGNFPTDVYLDAAVAELAGLQLVCPEQRDVPAAIDAAGGQLAIVQLTHVNYRTGERYDMADVTRRTHRAGGLVLWDLAHSAGAMPLALDALDVDFAVGCTYKYLNGGPGSPAYAYVARRWIGDLRQPLVGWHGHARPFDFAHDFVPHPGIERLLCGTAPQLSLIALEAALDAFDGIDLQQVRDKSVALGETFIALADTQLAGFGFELSCPRDPQRRGSQVSLAHPNGYAIVQALIARGVIGDFRAPDILRFGFAPLYVRHVDVWDAVAALRDVMREDAWNQPQFLQRKAVT
ncbi:MAG TPA: kynureninase [Burkholderiaceae bacterium]|nr:kynureninase [Burkholderiaceae bacterium]